MDYSSFPTIAEGKTKIVRKIPGRAAEVLIESKDDITAGDGAKRDLLPGKGALANETTCNCFELLRRAGVPTHFDRKMDERTFRAHKAKMVPIELVARRIATGSYLKRNPHVAEGTRFENLVLEFFAKDDAEHDPLIIYDPVGELELLFDAKKPRKDGFLRERAAQPYMGLFVPTAKDLLRRTFEVLEKAWAKQNVTLVDLKIECGWVPERRIVVADVIENDSWRIWPHGDRTRMLDKQVYRDLPESTPEHLREILAKYAMVAEATKKFVQD